MTDNTLKQIIEEAPASAIIKLKRIGNSDIINQKINGILGLIEKGYQKINGLKTLLKNGLKLKNEDMRF